MDNKKFKLALAITVLAIPLAVGGCGCSGCSSKDIEDIASGIESIEESEVKDTIEEDLADEGIIVDTPTQESEVTPTPTPEADISTLDTSMAGTFYVIAKDGIPYFAEDDESSEVLGTFEYDTVLTSQGMSVETHLFKIESEDGTQVWVSSAYLDTVRGGYNPNATEETPDATPTPTPSTTESGTESKEPIAPEIGNAIEDARDKALQDALNGLKDFTPPSTGTYDPSQNGQLSIGDGSSWTGGTMTMD